MSALFLDARFDQCRRPLWDDSRRTPIAEMTVCGATTLPGRTYCAECREVLIAGEIRNGRTVWFDGGRRTMSIAAPEEVIASEAGSIMGSPISDGCEVTTGQEVEPEGERPLLLDVQRLRVLAWGMAA